MDVKSVLEHCGLSEAHFNAIAEAVPEGYAALSKLMNDTPMFGQFIPGYRSLAHLRNVAVQFALQTKAGATELFFTQDSWNAARNYSFLQLQVGQVVLTSHYCGAKGSRMVRAAVSRAELVQRTPDLFSSEDASPDIEALSKSAYAQIVHGGLNKPQLIAIRIPNRDQHSYSLRALSLEPIAPTTAKVEEVADRLHEQIRRRKTDKGGLADVG